MIIGRHGQSGPKRTTAATMAAGPDAACAHLDETHVSLLGHRTGRLVSSSWLPLATDLAVQPPRHKAQVEQLRWGDAAGIGGVYHEAAKNHLGVFGVLCAQTVLHPRVESRKSLHAPRTTTPVS